MQLTVLVADLLMVNGPRSQAEPPPPAPPQCLRLINRVNVLDRVGAEKLLEQAFKKSQD